ncbi:MAG: TIGR02594 family protein [Bacteroidales bacterium]|nr:TIGR02594 family protein [Bacteroidales bacterium]
MSKLLQKAFEELGTKEIPGEEHNRHIVNYAKDAGFDFVNDDETPWCSIFVNWCTRQVGLPQTEKANARSWMQAGTKTGDPQPGDVVVFWRESIHSWKGHVGIFMGFNKAGDKVFCLGGNQNDSVSIAAYDAGEVLGFRRLEKEESTRLPGPLLRNGDQGDEVIRLQKLLNRFDCPCGDPDGIFGPKTADALKLFQANNNLSIDGIYGNETRDRMEALLQE